MSRFLKLSGLMLMVLVSQSASFAESLETQAMFTTATQAHRKNLHDVPFEKRKEVEGIVDTLAAAAADPYAASLPLIANAELGNKKSYLVIRDHMQQALTALDQKPTDFPQWMRNNSFKAWMFGRVVLSADAMKDVRTLVLAKRKLVALLNQKMTPDDSLAFFAWAEGYTAALSDRAYTTYVKKMMRDAAELSDQYKAKPTHDGLSNTLWAWVMNLSAAANAGNQHDYNWIKDQILSLTGKKSVTEALETGLLRTADSNDYPAWAMAKVRLSAAVMHDRDLYQEIETSLTSSIENAKSAGAKAEYALAVVDNELAVVQPKHANRCRL